MLSAQQFQWLVVASHLLLCGISPAAFAGPRVTYDSRAGHVPVVAKADVHGARARPLIVAAKGRDEVAAVEGTITGVLLQASAVPDRALGSPSIDGLSYQLKENDDAELRVTINGKEVTPDVPAWIWAVAARFADHKGTAAVTLEDAPTTPAEQNAAATWRKAHRADLRLLWVRCHPAVDDTLMGFFLIAGDAMIGDPEFVRPITGGLKGIDLPASGATSRDLMKSQQAARMLDALISVEAKAGDCVMLNDVDVKFTFGVAAGRLELSGKPKYRFSRKTERRGYRELVRLTAACARNRHLLYDINPEVYHTLDDFSRLVAFFNYIDETDPKQLDAFVAGLQPVLDRLPEFSTPAAIAIPAR